MKLLYEGKAKKIFEYEPGLVVMEFKDSLTAFNAQKKGSFDGKGKLNLQISLKIFELLSDAHVTHHFVKKLSDTQVVVKKLNMLPVEVVVRNFVAGSLASRLGIVEGTKTTSPIVEFYLKNDSLGDPILTENQIISLQILTPDQLKNSFEIAQKINHVLVNYFSGLGVDLIDFKIEIGVDENNQYYLADEISPDSCRLWDQKTKVKLDKDVFRRDLGSVEAAYLEIAKRMGI
jgi:phosphoribosylaminoimidazole-succinocarboxamide synthase